MSRCIIVQGPTYDNSINQIRECWRGYDVIYSTWKGYEHHYTSDDKVVFSDLPHNAGVKNLNYQKESTLSGLRLAKELGYDRALKWRSDMWCNNPSSFLELMSGDINTLCWVDSNGGYLTDFFMEGDISTLIEIWDLNPSGAFPERVITDRIISLGLLDKVHLIVEGVTPDNDVYWNTRYGAYWMHTLNNETIYKNNIIWKE